LCHKQENFAVTPFAKVVAIFDCRHLRPVLGEHKKQKQKVFFLLFFAFFVRPGAKANCVRSNDSAASASVGAEPTNGVCQLAPNAALHTSWGGKLVTVEHCMSHGKSHVIMTCLQSDVESFQRLGHWS